MVFIKQEQELQNNKQKQNKTEQKGTDFTRVSIFVWIEI